MHIDDGSAHDRLELLPRGAWPEPWRSMDSGAPPPRPNDVSDPEAIEPQPTPEFDPGEIVSIDWVRGTPHRLFVAHAKWHHAVACAADTGDVGPLIDLLRSDEPLHRDSRDLLAELLLGRQIARKRGGQSTPGRISIAQGALYQQEALHRFHRHQGLDYDTALRAALVNFKGDALEALGKDRPSEDDLADMVTDEEVERLNAHIRGKHGPTQRGKKRRRR